jgi:hypothetical protein
MWAATWQRGPLGVRQTIVSRDKIGPGRTREIWQPVRAPDGGTRWVKKRYLLDAYATRST